MTLPPCMSLEEPAPGYPVIHIQHPSASARVALHGAHVMEWAPAGQAPVLYMSPQSIYAEGKPLRGGIPVCWPWFSAHPADPAQPMHGLARIRFWQLDHAHANDHCATLQLSLPASPDTSAHWPPHIHCQLHVSIGAELEVALTTVNTGSAPYPLTEALHTYLATGDITRASVTGLEGAGYLDTVGTHAPRRQDGAITFDREVDRRYLDASAVEVKDPARRRTITVHKHGSSTTVVWNPWIEKSARLPDLPDDAWQHFLCVEAANASPPEPQPLQIAPRASHTLLTRLSLSPLI